MSPVHRSRTPARLSLALVLFGIAAMSTYWITTASAATTEVVDSDGDAGWNTRRSTCGTMQATSSHTFVPGPAGAPPQPQPPSGVGSLNFAIGPNGDSQEEMHNSRFGGVDLFEVDSVLDYWTFVETSVLNTDIVDEQAPYLILEIDRDANGTADDHLIFEPPYNGDVELGRWQKWNARTGSWWSTEDVEAGDGALPGNGQGQTLNTYRARFPAAQIVNPGGLGGLRIVTGCGSPTWAGFTGHVDALVIKTTVHDVLFDFEPIIPTPSSSTASPSPSPSRSTTRSPTPSASTSSPSPSPSTSSPSPTPAPTQTTDPRCRPEPGQNVITGTNRGERLRGTRGADLICAFGGNDIVEGLGGNDELLLGGGNDSGVGAGGNDRISGGSGRDSLRGGGGSDRLRGGTGRDICEGGPGRDRFSSCERRRS